jgi:hypothetical protein
MNVDIQTTVTIIFFLLMLAGVWILFSAFRAFREARRLRFFLKRRKFLGRAWQLVFYAALIITAAFLVKSYAEPITYQVFEPSPTMTLTPTITLTPTVTQTSTVTLTPTMTETPEFTPTPIMPAVISEGFASEVTPNPESVFSDLKFARRLTGDYLPIDPNVRFDQPNTTIFGSFSYDQMIQGTQWSALWFRDGELIDYESIPWNGASGGYGYTNIAVPSDEWLPGSYEIQIFVGDTWKTSGYFEIFGDPPTPTPTTTTTMTLAPTETAVNTATITPTETLKPSETPQPTYTSTRTLTPTLTATSTATKLPTQTPTPTNVPTQTDVPTQTLTPTATRRSTIFR